MADMDSLGVDMHVLSPYSGFYNYGLDASVAIATSRDSNNEIAEMVKAWPDRFAGLGTLPMQDVNAAIAELERIMTTMGFKGAMIDDKVNDKLLGRTRVSALLEGGRADGGVDSVPPGRRYSG